MIPIIGLLVGVYTVTRMLEIIAIKKEPPGAWTFLQVVAGLGILVTLFLMLALLTAGGSAGVP